MHRTLTWIIALASAFTLTAGANATETQRSRPSRAGVVETLDTILGYAPGQEVNTVTFPGATYVKLHFADLFLLPGDSVTVERPDRLEVHQVARPGWAMSVTGDTAVVRLHRADLPGKLLPGPLHRADLPGKSGVVARVDRAVRGVEETQRRREESVCGGDESLDAVCYRTTDPVPYRRSKAVARMLINGTELCTGFRVGAGNRMLTNHHCVGSQREAADTEVWFNYQCAECGGYAVFRTTKVWLSQVLASNRVLDFTLFSVTGFEQVQKFGYLELDPRRPEPGEQLYVPQHPSGKPAMIASANCGVADNAYEGYAPDTDISYYCDTEGGSSGSPVLSRLNDKVTALHHFGGCPNSGVRIERIMPYIQHLI